MKLKCLIADDEPLALDVLENFIKRTPTLNWLAVVKMPCKPSKR